MASSSSTKKAARLAQKGKGKRVRFQGGTIFPLAVAATLILGLALVVYARQSLPAADASEPTIDQHWHVAYGFYLCDQWYQLDGDLEERDSSGRFTNVNFLRTGIHSHDDGVIHWHPINSQGVGRNAVLGVFLDTYEVELDDDRLTFPAQNALGGQEVWDEDETQCDGEDAELSVKRWESFTDTDGGERLISNMENIHIDNDGMVIGIYFTPRDAEQVMPPWAQQLPQLGAVDSGQILPEDPLGDEPVVIEGTVAPNTAAPVATVAPGEGDDPVDESTVESTDEGTDPDEGSSDESDDADG